MKKDIGVDAAKLAGLQIDELQKLRNGQLTITQMEWWLNLTQKDREKIIRTSVTSREESSKSTSHKILRRLHKNKEIIVGATTGNEIIANAGDLFTGYLLDPDFKNWGTNNPSGIETNPTSAEMYKLHRSASFKQMFGSFGKIVDDLCWEQGQIINFCREHRDKFHPKGWATLFLFKVKGHKKLFVVDVYLVSGDLKAAVNRFDSYIVWSAENLRYLVVPQLVA